MRFRHVMVLAAAVAAIPAIGDAPGALAQQMGNQPWSFGPRNPSMAAQFEFSRKFANSAGAASTADGLGALNQYITQYNSTSSSIGNLNEVTQILSGGSTGTVGQSTEQTATGDQGSSATTDTTVNNVAAKGPKANAVVGPQAAGDAGGAKHGDDKDRDKHKN